MGTTLIALGIILSSTQLVGYLFERMRQPRLVGEILTGILLGPWVLGLLAPELSASIFGDAAAGNKVTGVLGFIYWFGLLLLMFIAGSKAKRLLGEENRKQTAWLLGIGTPLPFFLVLGLGYYSLLPLDFLTGPAGQRQSTLLVLAISVAVTSIPVITRIFYDLKILQTRFASLILGSAVIEDIILWGVLAIATALAKSATLAEQHIFGEISSHIGATVAYMVFALFLAPRLLRKLHAARWNLLHHASPLAYVVSVMFAYAAVASMLDVNLVFAAFLAGFGVVGGIEGKERARFAGVLDAIEQFSTSVFIPIYFTIVGYKLVFGAEFSLILLGGFIAGSSLLALVSVGLGAKMAGFKGLDVMNIAITTNARGGPGIVLASVAYDAGIINGTFYTTLVLAAVLTSQIAQLWLWYVLSKGLPLLSSNPEETWAVPGTRGEIPRPRPVTTPALPGVTAMEVERQPVGV
jgi:Kef-type K+ transport system membrane component KefB